MGDDVGEVGEARRLAEGRHHRVHEARHRHHQKQRQEARVQHQQGVHCRGRLGLQGARRRVLVARRSARAPAVGTGAWGRGGPIGTRIRFLPDRDTVSTSRAERPTCGGPKTLVTARKLRVFCSFCGLYRDS